MEKISLFNANNIKSEVYLVRYFKLDCTEYLVYTVFERDEKGFIKLYLIKVMNELGKKVGITITDEIEWKEMQKVIKTIIKSIKDNKNNSFEDLQTVDIEGIKVGHAKFFKLDQNLTNILSGEINKEVETQAAIADNEEKIIDYEKLCIDANKDIEEIYLVFESELSKLNELKLKFGNLPDAKYIEQSAISEENVKNSDLISDSKAIYDNLILKRNLLEDQLVNILLDVADYQLNKRKIGK